MLFRSSQIKYEYAKDNYFTELKNTEILQNRAQLLMSFEQGNLLGKYYSYEWARRTILHQSKEDIEEQDSKMEEEEKVKPEAQAPQGGTGKYDGSYSGPENSDNGAGKPLTPEKLQESPKIDIAAALGVVRPQAKKSYLASLYESAMNDKQ